MIGKTVFNITSGRFLELDIYLPELNKAIEYNSVWWHQTRKNEKFRDQYKQQWCKDNGIELLVINHKDWIKNKNWSMIDKFIIC